MLDGKHHALVGLRMGAGTEAAAAIAGVAPDINPVQS